MPVAAPVARRRSKTIPRRRASAQRVPPGPTRWAKRLLWWRQVRVPLPAAARIAAADIGAHIETAAQGGPEVGIAAGTGIEEAVAVAVEAAAGRPVAYRTTCSSWRRVDCHHGSSGR